jgi:hypothetical protein
LQKLKLDLLTRLAHLTNLGALLWPCLLLLLLQLPPQVAWAAELVVSYRAPETLQDERIAYDSALLRLALDKTLISHGPYRLVATPAMNNPRAISSVKAQDFSNFISVLSFDPDLAKAGLDYVRFPTNLGVVGYRVCFVAAGRADAFKQVRTLEDLRQFTHGQGLGWVDALVLRANGFKVIEAASYDALFKMLAKGRFDLFCRGVNEVLPELKGHQGQPGLILDRSIAFHYPLPQFFYTHRDNRALLERVTKGLQQAYADGSLMALFHQHYRASIAFTELGQRRIFQLRNPVVDAIDFDFLKYDYKPVLTTH